MWPRYEHIARLARSHGPQPKPGCGTKLSWRLLKDFRQDLSHELKKLQAPLFVLHGTADTRISVSGSRTIFGQDHNALWQYREVVGASHSFRPRERHWGELSASIVAWLKSALS
jgi:fermentation-respiration switch protein FrsA (DUF1100 family)